MVGGRYFEKTFKSWIYKANVYSQKRR